MAGPCCPFCFSRAGKHITAEFHEHSENYIESHLQIFILYTLAERDEKRELLCTFQSPVQTETGNLDAHRWACQKSSMSSISVNVRSYVYALGKSYSWISSKSIFFHFTDFEIGYKKFSPNTLESTIILTFPIIISDNADLSAACNLLSTVLDRPFASPVTGKCL
jgi:hypothetical protein